MGGDRIEGGRRRGERRAKGISTREKMSHCSSSVPNGCVLWLGVWQIGSVSKGSKRAVLRPAGGRLHGSGAEHR